MTTRLKARCSIYGDRPAVCRKYPEVDHYLPTQCTYFFMDGKKMGDCSCGEGACCAIPREKGLPGGAPLPSIAGGEPCKYLVFIEDREETIGEALGSK